jgi:antitoxin component HigA of HigAB toxin-antitoxin module
MKPMMINSRKEHADALARIEKLMDAAPGSPEEEELALWAPLVECYEEKNFPVPAANDLPPRSLSLLPTGFSLHPFNP